MKWYVVKVAAPLYRAEMIVEAESRKDAIRRLLASPLVEDEDVGEVTASEISTITDLEAQWVAAGEPSA